MTESSVTFVTLDSWLLLSEEVFALQTNGPRPIRLIFRSLFVNIGYTNFKVSYAQHRNFYRKKVWKLSICEFSTVVLSGAGEANGPRERANWLKQGSR
jgi:hypothetical protein